MRAMNSGPQSHGGDYQQRTESMLREAARLGSPVALKSLLAAGVTRRTATTSQLWLEVIKYANHGIKTDRRLRVAVSNQMHRDFVVPSQTSRRAIGATSTRAVARTDASENLLLEAIRLTLPPEIITSLTHNNQNLCARDPIGLTPLHLAVAGGLTKVAQILIDAGADANARDDSERTPLMHAVLSNEPHTLQLLLEYGADIHARVSHGNTAMAMASAQRDEGLMQWLAYFGAEAVSSRVSAQPQTKGYMTVPVKRNPHYIDRPELMAQIKKGFEDYETVVLTGLGGTGKTQLAVNYAEQLHDADNLESIFWVDGSSLSQIASSCEYLTQSVCSEEIAKPTKPEDVVKFFMKWLARQHERKWTLVLDNVEEENIFSMVAQHLRSGTGKGHRMLLTARNSRILGSSEGCSVKVGVFSQEDGLRLIGEYLPKTRGNALAAKLVGNLGQHPLAIVQAASYMANTGLSLEEYLELLDGRPSVKDQLLDQEFEQHRGPVQLPNALTKTWAITFDQIQQGNPSSTDVMAFVATLYGEKCPKSLLGKYDPKIEVESALKVLQSFHLIETSSESVSMHSLVRAATRVWLNLHGRAKSFQSRALQVMHEVFPSRPSGKTRGDCQQLLPQAQAVLQYDFDTDEDQMLKVKLLYATAMYQMDSSDFTGAGASLKSAKHIASSLLPDLGLRESLSAQSGLTSVYLQQGLLNQAIATEKEVYRARKDAFGIQDPDTIASLVHCGHVTHALGEFKEARDMYKEALRIQDRIQHVDKEQVLTAQAGLAATMVSAGNFKEGSKLQETIVKDRKRNLPEHDPQTLAAMNNLAVTLGLLGEFDKSEKLHREVLDVRRDLMGPLHLTTLTSSINLAQVYRAEGRWIEAEKLDREVLGDMQRSLGREHTLTLAVMANLALTLRERGVILYDKSRDIVVRNHAQIHEARALATSSFEAYKQMFGTQHPDTLKSQELCASILWYDDEEKRAEQEMKDVMSRKQQVLGEDHPDTLSSMAAYASILALGKDNQLLEAKRLDQIVLQGRRNTLGPDHPETLSAEENLAATNSALSLTIPLQPDGQQKGKFFRVVVYRTEIAERFMTCMDLLGSFSYHELQGYSALKNAALNLSLVRLRLARWSTMVHLRSAETTNDHREHLNDSHVARSEEETALVNVLTKMHSTLKYVALLCDQETRSMRNQSAKLLPRLMREIDRLSEGKMPTRSPSVGGRISRPNLGLIFQDHGKLRRFIDDMTDFTFSLIHLFPILPGPQENEYASSDVRALLDWLQTDITSQELEELSPILVQAAREVDPAFKLGMERGRHIFGGHTYDFVKAAGRAKIVMESSLNKDSFSRTAFLYERTTGSDHARRHNGDNYVRLREWEGTWNDIRTDGYTSTHAGNTYGYSVNDQVNTMGSGMRFSENWAWD